MRTAIHIDINGIRLQGTRHDLEGDHDDRVNLEAGVRKLGILSSNAGYQPRSSQGDLAAFLADSTSKQGFLTFRFDMPGVGDSTGELPAEVLPYYELVQNGGHVDFISGLNSVLAKKHALDGMIYVGHCGSATTAVYAAVASPSTQPVGLILLDPSFIWYRAIGHDGGGSKAGARLKERLSRWRQSLRAWLVQKPGGEKLTVLYSQMEIRCRRLLGCTHLPPDTNRRLIDCYRILLSKATPILMLTAPPVQKRSNYFDYVGYLQAAYGCGRLTVVEVEGAGHALLERNGKQFVLAAVEVWLHQHFSAKA